MDYFELRDAHIAEALYRYGKARLPWQARLFGFTPDAGQMRELYQEGLFQIASNCSLNRRLPAAATQVCGEYVGRGEDVLGMPFNPLAFLVSPVAEWLVNRTTFTGWKRYCVKLALEFALTLLIIEAFSLVASSDRGMMGAADGMSRLSELASQAAGPPDLSITG